MLVDDSDDSDDSEKTTEAGRTVDRHMLESCLARRSLEVTHACQPGGCFIFDRNGS